MFLPTLTAYAQFNWFTYFLFLFPLDFSTHFHYTQPGSTLSSTLSKTLPSVSSVLISLTWTPLIPKELIQFLNYLSSLVSRSSGGNSTGVPGLVSSRPEQALNIEAQKSRFSFVRV